LVNVTENVPGETKKGEVAHAELLLTTLWDVLVVLVHNIVSPALIVTSRGWNPKFTILTSVVAADACRAEAASRTAGTTFQVRARSHPASGAAGGTIVICILSYKMHKMRISSKSFSAAVTGLALKDRRAERANARTPSPSAKPLSDTGSGEKAVRRVQCARLWETYARTSNK
jgi:hypothetical protein